MRLCVYLEMIKFSHTIFALPFALLAAALASERSGGWRWLDLVGVVCCMVLARTAAMGFNRWADRELDGKNPRTKIRAIPAGALSARSVFGFSLASAAAFLASTSIFWFSSANTWPLILGPAVLLFLFGYSYAKRFTVLAHVWLGTALALAPIAAWIAIRGTVEPPPVLLGLAVVGWVTGFDIIYACQDIEVDRTLGLKSIPAWLGFAGAMWVARLAHIGMLAALLALGWTTPELGRFYWLGLVVVTLLLGVEHWLVRGRDLGRINVAFLNVNGVISAALLAVTLADLYLPKG